MAETDPPAKSRLPESPLVGKTVAFEVFTSLVPPKALYVNVDGKTSIILSIEAGDEDVFSKETV